MKVVHFTILLILYCAGLGQAQQQATFSQYMFNGLAINPAYAGSHDVLDASFLTRFQNVGMPGAPNTQTLAMHAPLVNEKVALGFLVVHDKISVIGQTGVNGIYAYRIPMKKGKLAMGVQAGFSAYQAAYSKLELYQQDLLLAQDVRQFRPNFGAGVYYSTHLWYAGISMPHLMNNVFQRSNNYKTVYQNIPLIISGGYVFIFGPMLKIKPNFLFKWVDDRVVEMDLNTNILFDNVIWLGVSYKFSNAATLLMEVQATEQFRFGYSYSITTGPIRKAELGSHEILLNYRLKYYSKGIVTPRYF